MTDECSHWTLDRRVPLAFILAICLQTGGFIWWAGQHSARLDNVEKRVEISIPQSASQADRLTRVEVKLESALDGIVEIKRLIQSRPTAAQ